jgi:hypothetical protein
LEKKKKLNADFADGADKEKTDSFIREIRVIRGKTLFLKF